ncbi:uncharacterized protein LOC119263114 isoform X2 [Pygocentrus nattereri]|uniref:uncharacterized protein LOC119263114 isoform X2 n=1 Tax=Pygocentrus nattereri TaxID=42514 RepID=UPI001891184E|nr:uncharacterized protein LOC119263114 isoform X2 [Pygocentrus nattereri]
MAEHDVTGGNQLQSAWNQRTDSFRNRLPSLLKAVGSCSEFTPVLGPLTSNMASLQPAIVLLLLLTLACGLRQGSVMIETLNSEQAIDPSEGTLDEGGAEQQDGSAEGQRYLVFCGENAMAVVLPPGSLSEMQVFDSSGMYPVFGLPEACDYSLTRENGRVVLHIHFAGCPVTVEEGSYTLRFLYRNSAGQLEIVTVSCSNSSHAPSSKTRSSRHPVLSYPAVKISPPQAVQLYFPYGEPVSVPQPDPLPLATLTASPLDLLFFPEFDPLFPAPGVPLPAFQWEQPSPTPTSMHVPAMPSSLGRRSKCKQRGDRLSSPRLEPLSPTPVEPLSSPEFGPLFPAPGDRLSSPQLDPLSSAEFGPLFPTPGDRLSSPRLDPLSSAEFGPLFPTPGDRLSSPQRKPLSPTPVEPLSSPEFGPLFPTPGDRLSSPRLDPQSSPEFGPLFPTPGDQISSPQRKPLSPTPVEPLSSPEFGPLFPTPGDRLSSPRLDPLSSPEFGPLFPTPGDRLSSPQWKPLSPTPVEPLSSPEFGPLFPTPGDRLSSPQWKPLSPTPVEPLSSPEFGPLFPTPGDRLSSPQWKPLSPTPVEPLSSPEFDPLLPTPGVQPPTSQWEQLSPTPTSMQVTAMPSSLALHSNFKKGCSFPSGQRLPCGRPGTTAAECLRRGCCRDEATFACYYPMDVCLADRQFIFVVPSNVAGLPINPARLMVVGRSSCKPVIANRDFAVFKFGVTECGTHSYQIGETTVYLAEVQSPIRKRVLQYGIITRDIPVRLMVECRYSKGSLDLADSPVLADPLAPQASQSRLMKGWASAGYMVKSASLPALVRAKGLYGVQLRIAQDETFTKFCSEDHQPLKVLLGKPVYLELRINAPNPKATLVVHYCVAYPRSAKSALVLLYEGCPNPLDSDNISILYVAGQSQDPHVRRFEVKAFQFMDKSTNKYLNEEIYFMCSTEVCMPSQTPCKETCFDGKSSSTTAADVLNSYSQLKVKHF